MELDLRINEESPEEDFDRIAKELLNSWILQVNDCKYRITELEFYFDSSKHHDSYAHRHQRQKTNGNWYFHGSGIDITIGSENVFGGILLRAIFRLNGPENKSYFYGPLNTVTELFSNLESINFHSLKFGLHPDYQNLIKKEEIIKAPRVGLNQKVDPEGFEKLYRYLVMSKEKHLEKQRIHDSLIQQGFTKEDANKIWK